ncbi:hypothetical protein [Pseudoalteromonas xiamenensis]|uniref:Zn-ribbon protein n=1 Tax=Pseudoalteromonas xiamenensis TaxID=882626 RepID=A0A975DH87_9GAMM|nr:hypothetical protein [Pseudoalteromonas xiamenensis]QTH71818.1 hypothetical protein J5O05_02375 [Pseudoalteromonas xiamenensis]
MAIVQCPSCSNSISSKHPTCPHCKTAIHDLDEEQLHRLAVKSRVKKQQKILNQSFIALILFLGGFLYLYNQHPVKGSIEYNACIGVIAVSCLWYLVNRAILVYLKKKN